MIKKKKFMMDAPDPTQSGFQPGIQQPINPQHGLQPEQAYGQMGAPNRDANSSVLKRDGSLNKLVNQKHLGPSALKERKPLANWPKENTNPS